MSVTPGTATVTEVGTATSISGTLPSDVAVGDTLVAWVEVADTAGNVSPGFSGWSAAFAPLEYVSGRWVAAYYRTVTALPISQPTVSWVNAGRATMLIRRYVGVLASSPLDGGSTFASGVDLTLDVPAVTTTVAGSRLVSAVASATLTGGGHILPVNLPFVVGSSSGGSTGTNTITPPGSLSLAADAVAGIGLRAALADGAKATAGSSGTLTWGQTAAVAWAGWATALRPDPAVGEVTTATIVVGQPGVAETATDSSLTAILPSGVMTGDFLLASCAVSDAAASVSPSFAGWTPLFPAGSFVAGRWYGAYYLRVADVTTLTAPSLAWVTAGPASIVITRYAGVDVNAPLASPVSTAATAGSTTPTVPAVTTSTAGARLVAGIVTDSAALGAVFVSPPTSMTRIGDTTGVGRRTVVAEQTLSTAGDTGSRTWTLDVSAAAGLYLVALRPATGTTQTALQASTVYRTAGQTWVPLTRSTITGAVTPPAPKPLGPGGTWNLIFSDDFAGTALDLTKWRPNWLGAADTSITGPPDPAEMNAYDPDRVTVTGGALSLTAAVQATTVGGTPYVYASGLVQSSGKFSFLYGYAEARLWWEPNTHKEWGALGGPGPNWPAWWLSPTPGGAVEEIVVAEVLGDNTQPSYRWDPGSSTTTPAAWAGAMPYSGDGFHVFGVDWRPDGLTFYYDGVPVHAYTFAVPTTLPHFLVLNLGLSGTQVKTPDTLKVDYVRVWQRPA